MDRPDSRTSPGTEAGGRPVQLLFPPLVESNFGSVYPAPAVLAGYLEANGVDCGQHDLNEEFAEYLLERDICSALGAGAVPGVPADSRCAAVARWVSLHRSQLIDDDGRHLLGPDSQYGWVMEILAQPFAVDPDAAVLQPLDRTSREVAYYLDFYERIGIAARIGEARLVGISTAMGPQLLPALALAHHVKRALPGVRVVLGGPAVSLMAEPELDLLLSSHRAVDGVVRYDGEHPLLALAEQALRKEWHPERVPGVSTRTAGGARHVPPGAGPNLNRLPRPRYVKELLDRLASPTLSITQARGCYWGKCDYCDFVELYEGSAPFRGRHPDAFTDEVEWLAAEFGINRFSFVTESIPPAFARRMSRLFLERELKVTWSSFAMVDRRFDREVLDLMVQAGCEFLVIGLETMITRVLKLVHKSADREENIRFLTEAHQAGMRLKVNLIPDLPSTTYEESLRALEDMEALAHCLDSVSVFPFEATRSSNVGRAPDKFGLLTLLDSNAVGQSQYALNHLHNSDPAMTPEERRDAHRRYREFARHVEAVHAPQPDEQPAPAPDTMLRLPVENLDVMDLGDRLVCTHMGTRQRLTVPPSAAPIIRPYLDGRPFAAGAASPGDRNGVPDAVRQLLSVRLLVEAPPVERSGR
ncbi:B12-binding domain-containing radical SAM protein [Kitasatospora sp. NPDC059571]|uniref:B12-binding domain-containing radical SAM protein n=1 Tax=Kitasatospora sp. NPDC059571 TaxID=3346871 RepID=UPI0036905ACC